ncbi:MAG: Endonuclease/exonuclease/phosphatase [Caulobacteraceae bacterium]|nr:Endonuclease/exonuclease/phosphatase [Caulobacteraceae bacterium]
MDRAALAFVAPAAVLAVLSCFGQQSARLDILSHFTLLYLAGCLAGLLFWLAGPRRRGGAAMLAITGLVCCLWAMAPELAASGRGRTTLQPGERPLRLLQFNIYKDNDQPEAAVAWILKTDPDVAALEDSAGPGGVIVEALEPHFPYKVGVGDTYIFSKFPIVYNHRLNGGTSVLAQVLLPDGKPADIAAVHILWPLFARLQAAQRKALVADLARTPRDDLIIAGDFNLTPWSAALKELDLGFGIERRTHGLPTWPARFAWMPPFISIDQIFAGPHWQVVSIQRGPRLGSDHFPLLTTLVRR